MPAPQEFQVLVLLALIPVTIAAMYSLVQVSEAIRNRGKPRANVQPRDTRALHRRAPAGDK